MSGSYGYASQLGLSTSNPVDRRFDFQSENLVLSEEFKDTNGLRGTRSRSVERMRAGIRRADGGLKFQPNSLEMTYLLQWILGGTPSGSGTVTYPLGDSLQTRYVTIDRVAKVFTYDTCTVDRATFRGSQGEPIEVDIDVCAKDETVANAGTFPALSIDLTTTPFMFHDLVFTLASTTYNVKDVEIVIDNHLDKERFFNSQTRTAINPTDRSVMINFDAPYGDATAIYNTGIGGVAVTAIFTNGSAVLSFTMTKVTFPRKSPSMAGREEEMIRLEGTSMKSGSTLELLTTLNPGP